MKEEKNGRRNSKKKKRKAKNVIIQKEYGFSSVCNCEQLEFPIHYLNHSLHAECKL
jgi:hypothetical protein